MSFTRAAGENGYYSFPGNSEMAGRVNAFDWAATPLGPVESWEPSLRTAVAICLASKFPMFVRWGPDLINIYNDAYIPMLGARHPAALGRPAREVWHEVWSLVGPQSEAVMQRGEATLSQSVPLRMERNGFVEETWFTWSYSPIPSVSGGVGGLFGVAIEDTTRVQYERDRERLDEERRGAEAHARTILESITDAFFALDGEWRFTYVNARAEQLLGRAPGDLLGKILWEVYPGLNGSEFERVYRRTLREHAPGSVTAYYPDHDRWYEVQTFPTGNGVSIYFRDVSDAKRLEIDRATLATRLAEQSRRYDMVLSSITDFAYTFDLQGRFTFVNKALLDLWGLPLAEALGKNFFDLHYPDDLAGKLQAQIAQVIQTGRKLADVTPYTSPTGEGGVYQYIFAPVIGADGTVEGVAGSTRDITQLTRVQEALSANRSESERQRRIYEAILTNTPDLAYVWDLQHRFTYANEVLLTMWGRTFEEAIGKTCLELGYEPWHASMHDREIDQVVATKKPVRGEVPFAGTFGRRIYDYILVPVIGADGEVEAVAGTTRDITDRKKAEEEREVLLASERSARADAERAGRLKDDFLATLSHELRTPLNAVLGWAQILRRSPQTPETVNQGLEVIERNARLQSQLIADLLDMSRILSGKMKLDVQRVELSPIIANALDAVRLAANAKGVEVESSTPVSSALVLADPDRLPQVVWNLVSNAVKFTPRGGKVAVTLAVADSQVVLRVADTGKGIRAEFLPHVFERFRQADSSAAREHGGLGLGLAIVKQLVEMHGGSVSAHSEGEGKGSVFTVRLPIASVDVEKGTGGGGARGQAVAPAARDPQPEIGGLRVLIVEDEPDSREMVVRVLEEAGVKVASAASAGEALALVQRQPFDVVISDIGLPGTDGYDLIRTLRARGVMTPASALTAFARAEDKDLAIRAGYQTHLTKPVDPALLLATVATLARRRL